ncbi:MAG: NAD(P)-dependent oxidoreductase [Planctomycetaceae bacterium]|nr:NAD(P)-dependent oxidoreductase [Planctomycetaceae bacterium]
MLHRRLKELDAAGTPIRVGMIGCGRMGTGVINQIVRSPGMRTVAVADQAVDHAVDAVTQSGGGEEVCRADSVPDASKAIAAGQVAVCTEGRVIPELDVDVVIDATGMPESGAQTACDAIAAGKHVVTLNVESDAVIGPILNRMAGDAGVVYAVIAGDEPGAVGHLYEWAMTIGLQVHVAGKGSMRPIDWNADEFTLAEEAAELKLNPKMLASFRDGSKHCVEMCVVSNGTGLVPDVRGTHARPARRDEMTQIMRLKSEGGMLSQSGVVEITPPVPGPDGKPDLAHSLTPGVYLIVTTDHAQIHEDFKYLLMGDGPYYLIHRPYHLCAMEVPHSVATAVVRGDPTLSPIGGPVSEVVSVAKRDLKAGVTITGSGGPEITGQIERHEICQAENLLPLGLSYDVKLLKDVQKGQALQVDDVALDEGGMLYQLWRKQQAAFG